MHESIKLINVVSSMSGTGILSRPYEEKNAHEAPKTAQNHGFIGAQ